MALPDVPTHNLFVKPIPGFFSVIFLCLERVHNNISFPDMKQNFLLHAIASKRCACAKVHVIGFNFFDADLF